MSKSDRCRAESRARPRRHEDDIDKGGRTVRAGPVPRTQHHQGPRMGLAWLLDAPDPHPARTSCRYSVRLSVFSPSPLVGEGRGGGYALPVADPPPSPSPTRGEGIRPDHRGWELAGVSSRGAGRRHSAPPPAASRTRVGLCPGDRPDPGVAALGWGCRGSPPSPAAGCQNGPSGFGEIVAVFCDVLEHIPLPKRARPFREGRGLVSPGAPVGLLGPRIASHERLWRVVPGGADIRHLGLISSWSKPMPWRLAST
jgi:hypothetical protein